MRSRPPALVLLALLAGCGSAADVEEPGESLSPIIGGAVDLGRDYVVGVGDDAGSFCTGVLISRRTVLTAGHCCGGVTRVFFGPDLADDPESVAASQEIRHPAFDAGTLSNDLCVVKLAEIAPVQPALLLREAMDNGPLFVGPSFTFVGYGNDGHSHYDVRRAATFPIVAVGPAVVGVMTGNGPIDGTQYFYDVIDKNTCDGDSGGPAFLARAGVERVTGVTSYGDEGCAIDGVNARADAPSIAGFIQPAIDLFEAGDPCRADGACNDACDEGGALVDPDCAESHCGQDGVCALACVAPIDPDCAGVDRCGADGACDPGCEPADADCALLASAPGAARDFDLGIPLLEGGSGADAGGHDGWGCSAARGNATSRAAGLALALGLLAAIRRRRPSDRSSARG
jgi:hypothetical protein